MTGETSNSCRRCLSMRESSSGLDTLSRCWPRSWVSPSGAWGRRHCGGAIEDRGLEPDDCYYLASLEEVVDWDTLNLDRDPPPDLALEVDVTRIAWTVWAFMPVWAYPKSGALMAKSGTSICLGADGAYQESPQRGAPLPAYTRNNALAA